MDSIYNKFISITESDEGQEFIHALIAGAEVLGSQARRKAVPEGVDAAPFMLGQSIAAESISIGLFKMLTPSDGKIESNNPSISAAVARRVQSLEDPTDPV